MKIVEYLKKLMPVFGRDRLQEDIAGLNNELQGVILPSFLLFTEQGAAQRYSSPFYKEIERVYKISIGRTNGGVLQDLRPRLEKLVGVLDVLSKMSQEEFQSKIVTDTLTARKATIVRCVEVVGFINKFSMSLANAIVTKEIETTGNSDTSADVPNGELKRLQKYLPDFCVLLRAITAPADIEKTLRKLPEVLIETSTMNEAFEEDMDPMGVFAATGWNGSVMNSIGMIRAEYEHSRYKHLLEQRKALELRLMHMKRRLQKQEDPQLEAEIEITSRRVATLAEKVRSYEESLG